jgi:hypothetical protein
VGLARPDESSWPLARPSACCLRSRCSVAGSRELALVVAGPGRKSARLGVESRPLEPEGETDLNVLLGDVDRARGRRELGLDGRALHLCWTCYREEEGRGKRAVQGSESASVTLAWPARRRPLLRRRPRDLPKSSRPRALCIERPSRRPTSSSPRPPGDDVL